MLFSLFPIRYDIFRWSYFTPAFILQLFRYNSNVIENIKDPLFYRICNNPVRKTVQFSGTAFKTWVPTF